MVHLQKMLAVRGDNLGPSNVRGMTQNCLIPYQKD